MVSNFLVEKFLAALQACGAEVVRLRGPNEAIAFVSSQVKSRGQSSLLVAPDVVAYFPQAASLASELPRTKEDWLRAEVSLVRADYGLARTGTLVHFDQTDEERLCWTLPPDCICLLTVERIVYEADELVPFMADHLSRSNLQSPAVSFVTGPSRTADIEGELVLGVHGPKRLIVLLLEASTE